MVGRRRADRRRWMARRARSSAPRGRRWLPRCAAPRAHLCSIGTRASWPGAWLPLTGAAPVAAQVAWCARSWRRRSARARGREARRLPLARARGRRVCRRHCPAAASRERDVSPSPGQPPSTPARWPGLLGRARRARRALVALERARLRRSCADARSGSVVAGAPPLSGRHTQNCRREAAASGFPRDRLRPRRPPDCIGFLLHSFSFEQ